MSGDVTTGELDRRLADLMTLARSTDEQVRSMLVQMAALVVRVDDHIAAQLIRTGGRNARCGGNEDRITALERVSLQDAGARRSWITVITAGASLMSMVGVAVVIIRGTGGG